MNRFQQISLAIACAGANAATAVAQASQIFNVINPTDVTLTVGSVPTCPMGFVCGTGFISFTHNITDNGFSVGDTINSATVNIFFTDPGGAEVIQITVSSSQTLTDLNMDSGIT